LPPPTEEDEVADEVEGEVANEVDDEVADEVERAALVAALDALPRRRFLPGPTPLEPAPGLAAALGLERDLLVKRDDLTGPGLGGNKVRKLEHLVADAEERGCDTLVTVGSAQSNHCRLTAVLGAAAGLDVHLVLGDRADEAPLAGNLALDRLAGATVHGFATAEWSALAGHLADVTAELAAAGRRPYEVPLGGSTALGAAGYVRAHLELLDQLDTLGVEATAVVHASSSGGTQAGLLAGRLLTGRGPRPVGVDVAKLDTDLAADVRTLAEATLALLGADREVDPDEVVLADAGPGAYGDLNDATATGIVAGIRAGGLVTDPVYAGRALGALPRLAREGLLPDGPVVYLHTGGQPALFAPGYVEGVLDRTG
jgi:L-cysteate sulfo-lyase